MGIKWDVEIGDKVSGPAHNAADAVEGLSRHVEGLHDRVEGLTGAWDVFEGSLAARVVERAFDAIVDSGKELIETAIEASERVTKLTEVFQAMSGGAEGSGKAVFGLVRRLSEELPTSEAAIQGWARSLQAAGVTDLGRLEQSLRATAGAEALVEGGGERVRHMLGQLNAESVKGGKLRFSLSSLEGTGVTAPELLSHLGLTPQAFELARKHGQITGAQIADAVTATLNEKAAKPLAAQMNELPTIIAKKGKEAFTHLLEGLNLDPLADSLRDFFSIFDLANPSGEAVRKGIGGALQFVIDTGGKALVLAKDLFLHVVIWSLEAAIAIKNFGKWWDALPEKIYKLEPYIVSLAAALTTLFVPAMARAIASAVLWAVTSIPAAISATIAWTVSMASAAIATLAATWPLLAIAAAVGLVVFGVVQLVRHWDQVKEFFRNMGEGAKNAATAIIEGLAGGIRSGASFVLNAVRDLGGIVIRGIKSILGIASPSRVMLELGMHTSGGFAQGIEAGTGRIQDASGGMAAAASPRGQVTSEGSRSATFNIDVTINAGHAVTAEQHREIVEEEFSSLASRLSIMMGAGVPA